MLLTEEEARTKRCCETLAPVPQPTHCNAPMNLGAGFMPMTSIGGTLPSFNCLGSGCMAWRWGIAGGPIEGYSQSKYGFCGKCAPPSFTRSED